MTFPKISQSYTDPHCYPEGVAFQDAQYLKMRDAKVSALDWGFLHSDATYDTVHVWDGAFFRLDLH
jgi:branched-chain amino acid aminotransferase